MMKTSNLIAVVFIQFLNYLLCYQLYAKIFVYFISLSLVKDTQKMLCMYQCLQRRKFTSVNARSLHV